MNPSTYIKNHSSEPTGTLKEWLDAIIALQVQDVFEVGSASGRDSLYLTKHGMHVICSDKENDFVVHLTSLGMPSIIFDIETENNFPHAHLFLSNKVLNHVSEKRMRELFTLCKEEGYSYVAYTLPQGDNSTLVEWNNTPGNIFCRFSSREECEKLEAECALLPVYESEDETGLLYRICKFR